jgi:hypothetical protein
LEFNLQPLQQQFGLVIMASLHVAYIHANLVELQGQLQETRGADGWTKFL